MVNSKVLLTPKTAPASDIAGGVARQHQSIVRQTGRHDGIGNLHTVLQLDQSNVIPETRRDINNHKKEDNIMMP